MMTDFINTQKDRMTLFDNLGYVFFPGQGTIDGNSKYFYERRKFKNEIVNV